ncbi:MAG TPA: glycosyltransferase family 4 protein [Gemmatimonadaceae bacterium]
MRHLFVTQDYGPDRGGMARRHVELVRRFSADSSEMEVSTVRTDGDQDFDRFEDYRIHRQPFHFREANRFSNQVKWARWLVTHCRDNIDVIHCGNIRPVGYAVSWASMRLGIPYIVYVNGGDLLREKQKASQSSLKRATARRILGNAAGIAATSKWVAELSGEVMNQLGVRNVPPTSALALGTDPDLFSPARDTGRLRSSWNAGSGPLILTVARLVPHKGQDTVIQALAVLAPEFPDLRYVLVGEGHDEERLRRLAAELHVDDKVIFAGAIPDADLPEAYATANLYAGASRVDNEINVEGFGISFLEASASGLPVVAGDSGGVRSAVRDGETGIVLPPTDVAAWSRTLAELLRDPARQEALGNAGRAAVESFYNWDRVARDTREFTLTAVGGANT